MGRRPHSGAYDCVVRTRTYGSRGPIVILLHGGPGAPGQMAPVARGLSDSFQILEPFQRESGGRRVSVGRHVEDLHALILERCAPARPVIVGFSWGAMLALAYAAAHPRATGPLALIGCGTFDAKARQRLHATVEGRTDPALRRRLERLADECPDPDQRFELMGELLLPLYSFDLLTTETETDHVDARANYETWADMLRLQAEGAYPGAFAAIEVPVLMLHGAADPHPGHLTRRSLEPYLPQLEYREWERCGHYPWLERHVRAEFFSVLRAWLARNVTPPADQR